MAKCHGSWFMREREVYIPTINTSTTSSAKAFAVTIMKAAISSIFRKVSGSQSPIQWDEQDLNLIGSGSSGHVYLGKDLDSGKPIAVKEVMLFCLFGFCLVLGLECILDYFAYFSFSFFCVLIDFGYGLVFCSG